MTRVNDPDAFAYRVDFAARVIADGRAPSRTFDSCFENHDGDAVAVALARRAHARPDGRLARNMWCYLSRDSVAAARRRYADAPAVTLTAWAADLRAEARAAFARALEAQAARQR